MSASATTSPHGVETRPSPKPEFFQFTNLGPVMFGLVVSGAAALGICLLVALFGSEAVRERLMYGWLFAFGVCFTLSAGSLFWIMLHHAVDAEWSVVVRRILEVAASTFFYLWIFFLPILIFAPHLYHWMHQDPAGTASLPLPFGGTHDGHPDRFYWLSRNTWGIRTVFYFVFFVVVTALLRGFSTRQDPTGDPALSIKMRAMTFPLLPFFALSLTFGVWDWFLTLNAHWYSTMWGVYLFAGSAWSSLSLLILVTYRLQRAGYLTSVVTREHYFIMGKLLLAFTIFWAYVSFSQYFLYWYGNIPEEVEYFRRRNTESWNVLNTLLVICHFFVCFVLLLPQATKKNPKILAGIAVFALCMHLLDLYIVIVPAGEADARGFTFGTFFLAAISLVAIGAPLAFLFLRNLGKHCLYPVRDPRVIPSLKLVN